MKEALDRWSVCKNILTEKSEAVLNNLFERTNTPELIGFRSTIHDVNSSGGKSGQNRTVLFCHDRHYESLKRHGETVSVLPDGRLTEAETAAIKHIEAACAATLTGCNMTAEHTADCELLRTPPKSGCQSEHSDGDKAFINFLVPVTKRAAGGRGTYVLDHDRRGVFVQPHIPKGGALRFPSKMPHYGPGNLHSKEERRNLFISFPAERNSIGHYVDEAVLFAK